MFLSNKLSIISLVLLLTIRTRGHRLIDEDKQPKEVDQLEFIQQPHSSSRDIFGEGGYQWLKQHLIPEYVKEFFKLLKAEDSSEINEDVVQRLFMDVDNHNCRSHVMEWIWRALQLNMRNSDRNSTVTGFDKDTLWVLHMLDAWGKSPEGILSGHVNAYGDFYECIDVAVSNLEFHNDFYRNGSREFQGRYCSTYFYPLELVEKLGGKKLSLRSGNRNIQKRTAVSLEELLKVIDVQFANFTVMMMVPSAAVCMPNSCSLEDVQQITLNALEIAQEEIPAMKTVSILPVTRSCHQSEKPDFDWAAILVMTMLSVITVFSLVTGIVDYWQTRGKPNPPGRSKTMKCLMAFSLYTNVKKLTSTRRSAEDFGCLHGVRFLSTSWVILCHTLDVYRTAPSIWNWVDFKRLYETRSILIALNGSFAVDTFFLMTGLLVTYNLMKMLDKTKGKINLLLFYAHRYLRLTPAYAILVAIAATLLTYLGKGPMWRYIEISEQNCRQNWWTNILYVNNFINVNKPCNAESWYLANDMQFYILSPFIVYPMWRWPRVGLSLLVFHTILSIIAPMLAVHYGNAPPALILTGHFNMNTFGNIYVRPWSRIQTFIVGVWVGWLLHIFKDKKLTLPRSLVAFAWTVSTVISLTVIFCIQSWFDPSSYVLPFVPSLLYGGLSRFAFAASVSWVMFACLKGYGGIVNSFLSWSVFMPLGRLSFCVYLTSLHIQQMTQARWPTPIRYDRYALVTFFFSNLVMSNLVGFVCTLLFETPFMILQRIIFGG